MSGLLDIGRVAQQGEHALVTQLSQTRYVNHAPRYGSNVDLKVAGVYDGTDRCGNGQSHSIPDAVAHMDELDRKAAEAENRTVFKNQLKYS